MILTRLSTKSRQILATAQRTPITSWRRSTQQRSPKLYSTRPGAADRYQSPMQSVISHRSKVLQSQPYEQLRVAGVTFEGRQDVVASLHKGQSLAFTKEPDNQYDPNAVLITTLDQRIVGYVPKGRTANFIHSSCFGKVVSVGQPADQQDVWGCIAEVQPKIAPMTVLPIPKNLQGETSIVDDLTNSENKAWEEFKHMMLSRSSGTCNVSGITTNSLAERWAFQKESREMKLLGFVVQSQEVTKIQRMLEFDVDYSKELQRMNNWTDEDVDVYLRYMKSVQNEYSEMGEWQLDLSFLQQLGVY